MSFEACSHSLRATDGQIMFQNDINMYSLFQASSMRTYSIQSIVLLNRYIPAAGTLETPPQLNRSVPKKCSLSSHQIIQIRLSLGLLTS